MSITRSFISSLIAALGLSALFGFHGEPTDTFAFGFALSLFYTLPYCLFVCAVSYVLARVLVPEPANAWKNRALSFAIGGLFCWTAALLLIWIGAPAEVQASLAENAKLGLLFVLGWCLYFAAMELNTGIHMT